MIEGAGGVDVRYALFYQKRSSGLNGGELFTLQVAMGHKNLRMARWYIEIEEDYLKEQHMIALLVDMLNQPSKLIRLGKSKRGSRYV